MSRRKSGGTMLPWMSAKPDCKERRFLQVGNSLLLSKKFQALGPGPRMLYLCMAMESGGRRTFLLPRSAAKKYGVPSTSLRRYIRQLADGGFVKVTSYKNLRKPNVYEFTSAWRTDGPSPLAISRRSDPLWTKEERWKSFSGWSKADQPSGGKRVGGTRED